MTKKDKDEIKKIISYEVSKNFKKLEKTILKEVISDNMVEVIKISVLEALDTVDASEIDHSESKEAPEDSWPFKVFGGRNYIPMSTKQFLNTIRIITDRAMDDERGKKRPFTGHDDFVEDLNIPNARNAQVFALKQIYDLIRWSNQKEKQDTLFGKIAEA
jgi:hypothetical protein